MGSTERRERERRELRARILDAARDLFAAEGVDAVTMRRVADRIEYSQAALYFHFKDKTEILRTVLEEDFLTFARALGTAGTVSDPVSRLRAAGHAYLTFAKEHPHHYRLMFLTPLPAEILEDPACPGKPPGGAGTPEEDAYSFIRGAVAYAMEQDCFRPELTDVDLVCQLLHAACHGVASLRICQGELNTLPWCPFDLLEREAIETALRGILRRYTAPLEVGPPSPASLQSLAAMGRSAPAPAITPPTKTRKSSKKS